MNHVVVDTDTKSGKWGFNNEVPYISAYWATHFAKRNRTSIPADVSAIIDNTPEIQHYIQLRDSLRSERDSAFKHNPSTSHA